MQPFQPGVGIDSARGGEYCQGGGTTKPASEEVTNSTLHDMIQSLQENHKCLSNDVRTGKKILHHIVTNREKRGGMTRQVGESETFLSPCANRIDDEGVEATVDVIVIAATDHLINEEEVQTKKKKIKPRKKRKKRRGRRMKENASKATDKDGY